MTLAALDAASRRLVQERLAKGVPETVVVVAGVDVWLGVEVATYAAQQLCGGNVSDIRVTGAASGTWTVGELEDQVLSPAMRMPANRHLFVVSDLGQAHAGVWDRLLLLVEEPAAPSLFFLVVEDPHELPLTLLGRTGDVWQLSPVAASERVTQLVEGGVDVEVAEWAVSVLGPANSLIDAVTRDEDLAGHVEQSVAADLLAAQDGYELAAQILAGFDALVSDVAAKHRTGELRSLLRAALAVWRRQVTQRLGGDLDATAFRHLIGVSERLDVAQRRLDSYMNPKWIVWDLTLAVTNS